jgi:hypothetical protein
MITTARFSCQEKRLGAHADQYGLMTADISLQIIEAYSSNKNISQSMSKIEQETAEESFVHMLEKSVSIV